MAELALRAARKHAKQYYRKDGRPTAELAGIPGVARILRQAYDATSAADFGLAEIPSKMIDLRPEPGLRECQHPPNPAGIPLGVAEELAPPAVAQAARAVPGLRKGQANSRSGSKADPAGGR